MEQSFYYLYVLLCLNFIYEWISILHFKGTNKLTIQNLLQNPFVYYGSVFVRSTQKFGLQVMIRRRISYDVSKNLATDEHETKRSERQPTT
jgi:hypothetical protein